MSIAKHHNEWLSLIEVSGPFLSMPVLMRTFPQGLNALDHDQLTELRLAYNEWLDNQNSLRPSPAIHSIWIRYVLEHVLGFDKAHLLEGPVIPSTLSAFIAEQGETLRPDLVIADPAAGSAKPRMLVQYYPFSQGIEKTTHDSHWKASPSMRMLELLRATGVSLGMVTNGEQWMLVNAPKGETSAFVSWYAALWLEEPLTYRAFTSLLGADRFFAVAEEDTLEGLLKESSNDQQEVTDQLGYQVRRAVEVLIRAIDKIDQDRNRTLLKDICESDLYEAALTVMMRLVFLFTAEERGLLLLGDPLYDENYAVSTLRAQLRETADHQGEEVLERRFDAWCRLLDTFRAVHDGIHHDRLSLPAYGGSLFDPDRYPFLEGRTSTEKKEEDRVLPISNRTVLHLLDALQVLRVKVPGGGPAEARRLSFRALDVEQIGHVYEGLLDHIAVRAKEPVLGLTGTRENEPELPLSVLKTEAAKGEKSFLVFLHEQTGRSVNALRNAWQQKGNVFGNQHLQIACNNDTEIYSQVAEFAGLLREDDFGYPAVFLPGSVYVTAGATRRATGTHYTPKSLTEPIVQHTLEPLVYTGPAEGLPKEQWKLKSPAELLELKVCDMAMGSAGFLVQVIRYLSERLVEAWDNLTPDTSINPQPPANSAIPQGNPYPNPLPQGDPHLNPLPQGEGIFKEALSPEMLERVRELRRNATEAEALLWELLRDRHLEGFKFRRQHPLGGYILDFYCHEARLAVEIDGAVHHEADQAQHDADRSAYLNEQGIRVIRFWNHEVLSQTDAVLQKILEQIQSSTSSQTPPFPVGSKPNGSSAFPSASNRVLGDSTVFPFPLSSVPGDSSAFPSTSGRGKGEGRFLRITPEGKPATGKANEIIIPKDDEERLTLAKRLVADRCIYGVDKNPLAVEIAKLSIWLTTMDKGRPFTFLDHALKCGDSLVGAYEEMYKKWAFSRKDAAYTLDYEVLNQQLEQARQKRKELESFTVLDVRDAEHKAELLKEADAAMARVKLGCDLLVGVRLLGLKPAEQETLLSHLLWDYVAGLPMDSPDAQRALLAARKEHAFHWPFEFPEIFEHKGFDAFIGNPPFMWGLRISTVYGINYFLYLRDNYHKNPGTADFCSYFILRNYQLINSKGIIGSITTNTIAQGDTREVCLEKLITFGATIIRAEKSKPWPGNATLEISVIHISKGDWGGKRFIDDCEVEQITSYLDDRLILLNKYPLMNNKGKSFIGQYVMGMGFLLDKREVDKLILINSKTKDVIMPFLNGNDVSTDPHQKASRYVIYFGDMELEEASKYKDCIAILRERVKPERDKVNRKKRRDNWWKFAELQKGLLKAKERLNTVYVQPTPSKYLMIAMVASNQVFAHPMIVFPTESTAFFACLISNFHESWARYYSSTLGAALRYSPSDCFETFPFPQKIQGLEIIGKTYEEYRTEIMHSRMEGLTSIYNRFHDIKENSIDIINFRKL
ncbi:MAG: endonuclease domain-containing protein, partial [Smithella sp.]